MCFVIWGPDHSLVWDGSWYWVGGGAGVFLVFNGFFYGRDKIFYVKEESFGVFRSFSGDFLAGF